MELRGRKFIGKTGAFGFTLTELIVVIAVLATLATIGFLALSGYTQDARDSAIKANVRSIQSAIVSEASLTGESPRKFVIHDGDYALSWAFAYVDGTGIALTWGNIGESPLDSNYSAGRPNFIKLKLNSEKFRISSTSDFTIGKFVQYATNFASQDAEAAYDPTSSMVGAADFLLRGGNGRVRSVSYVQTAGISPTTKIAWAVGNFPTTGMPEGYASGLLRAEPGSVTGLTWALIDGQTANPVSNGSVENPVPVASTILNVSPAVLGKTVWNLSTDGPLILSSTGSYSISPQGITTVKIKAWGAAGSNLIQWSSTFTCVVNLGWAGWFAEGTLPLSYGSTYLAVVGEAGRFEWEGSAHGGGGLAQSSSAGSYVVSWGGWLSWIFEGSFIQQNAILIAWAGGWAAGSEGGAAWERAPNQNSVSWGGYPGTLTAWGTRWTPATASYNTASNFLSWSALQWGQTLWSAQSWGGGGSGYFWGGPGAKNNIVWSGGGGGSNFAAPTVVSPVLANGTWVTPWNSSDLDRGTAWSAVAWVSAGVSPISTAFASCRGNNGKIIISLP